MRETLIKAFGLTNVPLIPYRQLEEAPFMERLEICPGVFTTHIPVYETRVSLFFTEMESGSEFENHRHDCKEIVTVMIGQVEYRGRTYGPKEKFIIHKNVKHAVTSKLGSRLFVEFVNPHK